MTGHISEELPLLLTGEASRDAVMDAATHLRGCEDCQQELVSAVVAHASLTSAHRFAPEIVARSFELPLHDSAVSDDSGEGDALPDLSSIFAQVREEAAGPSAGDQAPEQSDDDRPASLHRARVRRFSPRTGLAVAAAAAGIVIGAGSVAVVSNVGGSGSSGTSVSVALSAYDKGTAPAKATVTDSGRMTLDASALPSLDAAHRYEVWLTNDARTQMQPIGWIGNDGKAELTVPSTLMSRYSDIEVSVQRVDAPTYTYSGTSVLRGGYTA